MFDLAMSRLRMAGQNLVASVERVLPAVAGGAAEAAVGRLYLSLTAAQRREICLPWDFADERRGLVRRFIANHWQVTRPCVKSDFFSDAQQALIREIFLALLNPTWHARFLRQMSDDAHGHPWGQDQSIAIFGDPSASPWQFLFTGRHLTLRVDGDRRGGTAFGGPIVYAHAATGFHEKPDHPGNIFWPQALCASELFGLLDERQKRAALPASFPREEEINFRAEAEGVPVATFTPAQMARLERLLVLLLEPFRKADQIRVIDCLNAQGSAACLKLSFREANRMSVGAFDDFRLEGPAFIWHFQGVPHVHCWVHVAARPGPPVKAARGAFIFPEHDGLR